MHENQDRNYKEWQSTIVYMEKRNSLLESMERKQKFISGALDEIWKKALQDVKVLKDKISEVESELREAEDELRLVEMERRRTEAKGLRVMDAAGADVWCEAASGAHSSKAEVWSPGEPGVDVDQKRSLGDQSAMRGAGGSQKNAQGRIVPAERMEVDRDEAMEQLSFVSSAVSDTAG